MSLLVFPLSPHASSNDVIGFCVIAQIPFKCFTTKRISTKKTNKFSTWIFEEPKTHLLIHTNLNKRNFHLIKTKRNLKLLLIHTNLPLNNRNFHPLKDDSEKSFAYLITLLLLSCSNQLFIVILRLEW